MPAPRHIRITLSGIFGPATAPLEEWNTGFALAVPNTVVRTKQELADITQIVLDNYGALIGSIEPIAALTNIRAADVADTGKYSRNADGSFAMHDRPTEQRNGLLAAPTRPLQTALAITLLTSAPGPTGRGRMYLPAPTGALGTDARLAEVDATRHAERTRLFLQQIDTALQLSTSPGHRVAVASGGSVTKGIAPSSRVVEKVGAGRVLDTQRRRRGDLAEDRIDQVFVR